MKTTHKLCALAVAAACAFGPATLIAADSHSASKDGQRLVLNAGKKWTTDETLRRGMDGIRAQVAAMRESSRLAPLPREHYAALGASIKREIGDILANCKLDAEADRNFHVVLNQLGVAADTLEGRHSAAAATGLDHAELVLAQYARFFEHPGWSA
jgi:hypothetical protein